MVTIEVHSHNLPKMVTVIALQNGKQLLKSPMKCKTMTKKSIESQIRKDLKVYDGSLYGGLSILFFIKLEEGK
ncbi:hypothetical protein [Acinetobacter phage vB_AbaM_IME284]|nr:hypothetical protein [Acinetobacter phage vB_AbaM_IME284]